MSQFFIESSASPPPPTVMETLTGDTGTNPVGVDGSNNINVFGDPNAPGIITRGDAAANTVFFGLEQPTTCGTGQTINVGTADLVTLPLGASAATYTLRADVAGKAATASAIGGTAFGVFKTDGSTASVINTVDVVINADLAIVGASFTLIASGGSVSLLATGSLGSVINWKGCITYVSVIAG